MYSDETFVPGLPELSANRLYVMVRTHKLQL